MAGRVRSRSRVLLAACLGLAALAGCGGRTPVTAVRATPRPIATPAATDAPTPAPLVDPSLDPNAPPVAVPLRFVVPSLGVDAPILAVGRTPAGAMDAPEGPASSPLWKEAFWYRGGSDPGQPGTVTIAGHVDDVLGRPAAFWNIRSLKSGDIVEIMDGRDGRVDQYRITDQGLYTITQTNSPAMLPRIYGDAAYTGYTSLRNQAADSVSRISVITCTGTFHPGSDFGYDHRAIAFGVLVPPTVTVPAGAIHPF